MPRHSLNCIELKHFVKDKYAHDPIVFTTNGLKIITAEDIRLQQLMASV